MTIFPRFGYVDSRVAWQPAFFRTAANTGSRERYNSRMPRVQPPRSRGWWDTTRELLHVGGELLFAAWALVVLAFWIAIIAGLVL